jgi:hypothetical protein
MDVNIISFVLQSTKTEFDRWSVALPLVAGDFLVLNHQGKDTADK